MYIRVDTKENQQMAQERIISSVSNSIFRHGDILFQLRSLLATAYTTTLSATFYLLHTVVGNGAKNIFGSCGQLAQWFFRIIIFHLSIGKASVSSPSSWKLHKKCRTTAAKVYFSLSIKGKILNIRRQMIALVKITRKKSPKLSSIVYFHNNLARKGNFLTLPSLNT